MTIPSWEAMIESVDTVERDGDHLTGYFTLKKDKEHVAAGSMIFHDKFPKKMLKFYMTHRYRIMHHAVGSPVGMRSLASCSESHGSREYT